MENPDLKTPPTAATTTPPATDAKAAAPAPTPTTTKADAKKPKDRDVRALVIHSILATEDFVGAENFIKFAASKNLGMHFAIDETGIYSATDVNSVAANTPSIDDLSVHVYMVSPNEISDLMLDHLCEAYRNLALNGKGFSHNWLTSEQAEGLKDNALSGFLWFSGQFTEPDYLVADTNIFDKNAVMEKVRKAL